MRSHRTNRTKNRFLLELERLDDRLVPSGGSSMPAAGPPPAGVDVLTYHNDNSRTGANLNETTLTPQNVNASSFGKLFSHTVDGFVYAQPLVVSGLRMSDGQVHNVLFVATENDSVYALDANDPTAGPRHDGVLWQTSFIDPARGITPVPFQDVESTDIRPVIGITGTPVIDQATETLYVVSKVKVQPTGGGGPHYVQQFHALDLRNGRETHGSPVTIGDTTLNPDGSNTNDTPISVPGTGAGSANGVVAFNALRQQNRAGLVLDMNVPGHPDGVVFASFGSHGDHDPYHGWLVGFDAKTLKIVTLFNTDPNGNFGAVWQGGAAPSVAANGDLIFSTGNGTFDAFTTTTPPGPAAQGEAGFGLGYAGIGQSVGVSFGAVIPTTDVSSTGLFHNGVYPTDKPVATDVFQPLIGTGIDFTAGAEDPNGPHTFRATLSYSGTTLSETITDQTTGASFSRTYSNVNLPTTVGGNTAFVGFGGSTDGRQATMAVTDWTYSSGGQTLIDHSGGFASNGDLTATGVTTFTGAEADLTTARGEQSGNLFANSRVNIRDFTTTFDFQMRLQSPSTTTPIGDGLTFIIQNDTGHRPGPDYGQSVVRLSPTPGTMTVVDSFTPFNFKNEDNVDADLGPTSVTLLPDFPGTAHPHEAVLADKGGNMYLVDQDNLGGFNPGGPNRILQQFAANTSNDPRIYSSPVFFDGKIYIQGDDDVIKAFALKLDPATNTMLLDETPVTQGTIVSAFPGTVESVSADGTSNGIVWSPQVDAFASGGPAILRAYDANNLSTPLYASNQAGPRDTAGGGVKFTTPTIANGMVYLGTQFEVDVYGLLGQSNVDQKKQNAYLQTDLVSNAPGMAETTDPSLVNPWGLTASGTSPFWVSDNNTGLSTLYNGQGTKNPLTVTIPAAKAGAQGTPTGTVANPVANGFEVTKVVNGKPVTAAPAFLFDTLDGTISGWSPALDPNNAPTDDVIAVTIPKAVFTGLTLDATTGLPPRLYAADWAGNAVDVFDQNFKPVDQGAFQDPAIPSDFHVFNVQDLNGLIYVTYAKFDPTTGVDASGPGNGFVDVFSRDGVLQNHLVSHNHLNSPWGLAIAPAGFGAFGGDLLVGNFGDGTIHAYDPHNGHFEGTLRDAAGKPITIGNLWALRFGNNSGSGSSNTLFFTAGVVDDPATPFGASAGLLGSLQAIPSISPQAPVVPSLPAGAMQSISTVPANGDQNPYGVAFVPQGFPSGGALNPGDLLVSDFNNAQNAQGTGNLQGTGSTILRYTPAGDTSVFFQGQPGLGLTGALGVLKSGFVIAGSVPTTDGTSATVQPGSLLILDSNGKVVETLADTRLLDGPWFLALNDKGSTAQVFVSDVLSGTVTRIDLMIPATGAPVVESLTQIASGYAHRADPNALVVGPAGLAFDAARGTLYVASTADNAVYAIPKAATTGFRQGKGNLVVRDDAHLHGPIGLALAPNGDLIVSNGDAVNQDPNQLNELDEFTKGGVFVGQFQLDKGAAGGAFGVAVSNVNGELRFAAVDDDTNSLDVWTFKEKSRSGRG